MVSLLARLPRRGKDGGGPQPLPLGWLAVAAILAVDVAGLAGLGLAVVVVQTLDPAGGLPFGGSTALAGQLWLLAQGGELELDSGPLVLAPLLLTLGIAWGLSRAGRGVARAPGPDRCARRRAGRRRPGRRASAGRPAARRRPRTRRPAASGCCGRPRGSPSLALVSVGWGVGRESGLARPRPGPAARRPPAAAARRPGRTAHRAGPVHRRRRRRAGLRRRGVRRAVGLPRRGGRRGRRPAGARRAAAAQRRRWRCWASRPGPGSSSVRARSSRCTG